MDREECPPNHLTDANIDELVQEVQLHPYTGQDLAHAPDLRMAHDIRCAFGAETREDANSLARVLARLNDEQAETQSKILFHPHVYQHERVSTVQNSFEGFARSKSSSRWQQRTGLLIAAFFLTLLVGGALTVFSVTQTSQNTLPTANVATNAISAASLSDNANQSSQAPTMQLFAVGQTIWLSSDINIGKVGSGVVTLKWYENNHLYATSKRGIQAPKAQSVATVLKVIPLRVHQVFTQPGDGKVEIYWNGQLVTTLHFVIK